MYWRGKPAALMLAPLQYMLGAGVLSQTSDQPHVVIVGGGFAGLHAAKSFKEKPVRVTLIDQKNHHLFQPLLYQVATAALSATDIASPIRSILRRQKNARVLLAEVTSIDLARREVILEDTRISYDYLILAAGARHSYFGHDEWEAFAPGLKNLDDALRIRRRILMAFEAAERETDQAERERLLTFVIVGAGPTGVELAGAIAELSHFTLARDFADIDPADAQIYLLEALPRILPMFQEKLAARAVRDLTQLGVSVRTGAMVSKIEPGVVHLGDEEIKAATILWAAGVAASPLARSLDVPLDRAGRVLVQPDLSIPGHPEVIVAGDLASLMDANGKPLPGVAPVAMQEGDFAAANIMHRIAGEPTQPFTYKDKGNMATIGRNSAIAQIGKIRLTGFVAWIAWLFIHIMNLIGYRNRAQVMFQWMWAYGTHQRGARLITEHPPRLKAPHPDTEDPTSTELARTEEPVAV